MTSGSGARPRRLKLYALCGVIAPVLFTIIVITLGLLRTDYSHVSQPISELGSVGAPNAIVQDGNFILFGLLIIAFAYGLHKGIGDGKGSRLGPILIAVFGAVAAVGDGIFPLPGPLHQPLFIVGVIAFMIGILVITRRLKRDISWQRYRLYSLGTGAIAIILFLVLLSYVISTNGGGPWFGALQRIFVAPLFLWIEIMAIHLLKLSNQSTMPLKTP